MQIVDHPRKPRAKSRRALTVSLIVLAALAGGGAYYWTRPAPQAAARAAPAVPVTVTAAASRDVPIYLAADRHRVGGRHRDDPQPEHRNAAIGQLHRRP